jgi:hypothetical protein
VEPKTILVRRQGRLPPEARLHDVLGSPERACGYRACPARSFEAVVDKAPLGMGIVPGVAATRAASSRAGWTQCSALMRKTTPDRRGCSHVSANRMAGERGGDSDGARDCSAGQACSGDPTLADARASAR